MSNEDSQGDEWGAYVTLSRTSGTNVGSPTGREPYGDTVPVVVAGVTTGQGELWGEEPPPSAVGTAQTYIYQLRKILDPRGELSSAGEWLVTKAPGYLMRVSPNQGCHRELIGEMRSLVATHPLKEWFHGQLIVALSRSGRRGEALQAYQDLRTVLSNQLGLDPQPELQWLHREVLSHGRPTMSAFAPYQCLTSAA